MSNPFFAWLSRLVCAGTLMLLASCASMLGPREVDIPLDRLQSAMAKKFPYQRRYLELIDVNVTNPQLALQPQANRLLTRFDASFVPIFMRSGWSGSFAVSGALRFDASRNAIVLADPKLEQINIDGLGDPYSAQVTRIGQLIAAQWLQDTPLYTFRPEDLRYLGTRYTLSKITTTPNGLVITFDPLQ